MASVDKKRLVLRNDLAELDKLTAWIEAWTRENTSPNLSFNIQLCLEEAVANAIMYGTARDDHMEIAVELEGNGGTVLARIEDTGRPFDPTQVPPPALATSLDEAEVGSFWYPFDAQLWEVLAICTSRRPQSLQFVEPQAVPHQRG
jgi:serine/threonine-protein kinase RsbW